MRANEEINAHIECTQQTTYIFPEDLPKNHSFKANIGLIMDSLLNHIKGVLPDIQKINKDVLITLYRINNIYEYENGFTTMKLLALRPNNQKNLIRSHIININSDQHENYLCSKCIREQKEVISKFDCQKSQFSNCNRKRAKHIHHYIGINIKCMNKTVGFLNIELLNRNYFVDEEEMQEMIASSLIAYQQLIQYQFIKKIFFKLLADECAKCKTKTGKQNEN